MQRDRLVSVALWIALALAGSAVTAEPAIRAVSEASRPRYAPAATPELSAAAYRRVLEDAVADPSLELFTLGSRVLRARRPLGEAVLREQGARLAAAGELRARVVRDRAVLSPASPRRGFLPVLLQRVDGSWRIDQVEMEKSLALDSRGNLLQLDDLTPYAFGIEGQSVAFFADLGGAELFGEDPAEAIARLEAAELSARGEFRLAEVLLRSCWLVTEALAHYDEALRLAPDDWEVARLYGRRMLFLGLGDRALPHLARFGGRADELTGMIHAERKRFEQARDPTLRAILRRFVENGVLPAAPEPEPKPLPGAPL